MHKKAPSKAILNSSNRLNFFQPIPEEEKKSCYNSNFRAINYSITRKHTVLGTLFAQHKHSTISTYANEYIDPKLNLREENQ